MGSCGDDDRRLVRPLEMATRVLSSGMDERSATTEGLGVLQFLGQPVLPAEHWVDDDLHFIHTIDLDLVACAPTVDEAAQKIGHMIFDLFESLNEDADLTEAEHEAYHLIGEHVIAPLVNYHRRRRREHVLRQMRRLLRHDDWGMGPVSTHGVSAGGLHV
jgi:hypothetical protein